MVNNILERLKQIIDVEQYNINLFFQENKGAEDSFVIQTQKSALLGSSKQYLLANIKTTGKTNYVRFSSSYSQLFKKSNVQYEILKSQPTFLRIDLDTFIDFLKTSDAEDIISKIFDDLFSSQSFGCCHLYVECSDAKKCLNSNKLYALSCQYKKNLDNNLIFYGSNRNV